MTPDRWFAGDGTGGFYTNPALGFSFTSVAVADMNGDGIDDLVVLRGDSVVVYVSDGDFGLTQTGAVALPLATFDLGVVVASADMTTDGAIDIVALVSDTTVDTTGILLAAGDGGGGLTELDTRVFAGTAGQVTIGDINRDFLPDIIVSDASAGRVIIYFNNAGIGIDGSQEYAIGGGEDLYFALATADLDRNGQPDFVSGSASGSNLILSINDDPGLPVIADELKVTGYDYTSVRVTNPLGFVISRNVQTVAGSAFYRLDIDSNGIIDDRLYDYNLQYGEYLLEVFPEPGSGPEPLVSAGIGINGSQKMTIFDDYLLTVGGSRDDSVLQFYLPIEQTPSFYPLNGLQTHGTRVAFDWTMSIDTSLYERYEFQLDRYFDFRSPLYDDSMLSSPRYLLPDTLSIDSVYYWRVRAHDGAQWTSFSHERALHVGAGCCVGWMGNLDGSTDEQATLGDLTVMIDHLFISLSPLACVYEANLDKSEPQGPGSVTLGDLTIMIDHLFISLSPLPPCP